MFDYVLMAFGIALSVCCIACPAGMVMMESWVLKKVGLNRKNKDDAIDRYRVSSWFMLAVFIMMLIGRLAKQGLIKL